MTLTIEGRKCDHRVAAVMKTLATVPGVGEVEGTLSPPRAVVSCDSSGTTVEMLTKATAKEGYPFSATAG